MKYDLYQPARDVTDIQARRGMTHTNFRADGLWRNQKAHAHVQVDLILHHYPRMDKATQLRANKTLKQLSDQYGISI